MAGIFENLLCMILGIAKHGLDRMCNGMSFLGTLSCGSQTDFEIVESHTIANQG